MATIIYVSQACFQNKRFLTINQEDTFGYVAISIGAAYFSIKLHRSSIILLYI